VLDQRRAVVPQVGQPAADATGSGRRHPERRAQREDDAAQIVAAELIGAEEVLPFRCRPYQDVLEVELVERVGREARRKHGEDGRNKEHDQADNRQPVPEEAPPGVRPLAARLDLQARLVAEDHVGVG